MPASPVGVVGAVLYGNQLFTQQFVGNDLSDVDIIFSGGAWDALNKRFVLGSNDSAVYFGTFDSNVFERAAALVSTVITNGAILAIDVDPRNGDIYALSGGGATNGIARSVDGGANWTDINPAGTPAGNRTGIVALSDGRLCLCTNGSGGFNFGFSDDLGLNWTAVDSGVGAGGNNTTGIAVNRNRNAICMSSGFDFIAFSLGANLAASPPVFTAVNLGLTAPAPVNDAFHGMAFNSDATVFLCGGNSTMYFSRDSMQNFTQIVAGISPFMRGPGANANTPILDILYSVFYSGFFVMAQNYGAFVSEASLLAGAPVFTPINMSAFSNNATIPLSHFNGFEDGLGSVGWPLTTVVNVILRNYPVLE